MWKKIYISAVFCIVYFTGQPHVCQKPTFMPLFTCIEQFPHFSWIDFSLLRLPSLSLDWTLQEKERVEWEPRVEGVVRWWEEVVHSFWHPTTERDFSQPQLCVGLKASHKKKILSVCYIIGALLDPKSTLSGFVTDWGKCLHWKLHLYLAHDICVLNPGHSVPRNPNSLLSIRMRKKRTCIDIFMCKASISPNTEDTCRVGMSPVSLLWLSVL